MDEPVQQIPGTAQEVRATMRVMRGIATAGLRRLYGELVAAEGCCDEKRAAALRADIATATVWLTWAEENAQRTSTGRQLRLISAE